MSTASNFVGLSETAEVDGDDGDSDSDKPCCVENWIKGEISTVDMCNILCISSVEDIIT